jgi:hypothetical protein
LSGKLAQGNRQSPSRRQREIGGTSANGKQIWHNRLSSAKDLGRAALS